MIQSIGTYLVLFGVMAAFIIGSGLMNAAGF